MLKENQINAAVEQISNDLFSKVKHLPYLNGTQIAQFCHYEQINRFLLFQIYIDWKSHTQKLKHPYFDFQHPEVKNALNEFLNVLSNHIHIEQKNLKSLIEKAVYNTLKLLQDPQNSFLNFFFASKNEVSTSLISEYLPYFYDFDFVLQSILLYAEKHHLEKIHKEIFQDLYPKTIVQYEKLSGTSLQSYQNQKLKELLGQAILNTENEILKPQNPENLHHQKPKEEKNVELPQPPKTAHSPAHKKEIKIQKIPLNKQFQYSQKLFKGDLEALKKFCNQIAQTNDLNTAKNLIQEQILTPYQIDPEDALFQEFVNLALHHIL